MNVGGYELREEVGRGGMGVVWRALDPRRGRTVAIKLLHEEASGEPARRRFQQEVQAMLRVRHPGVVALLDAGDHVGAPFLVMEWIEGETLQARLRRAGPLDPREAAELVRRLALAMAHVHAQGLLHRDLKPGNVMLRAADGAPLVMDLGLAREVDPLSSGTALTIRGVPIGTPGYWSPEQARGDREAIGPRSDVHGLGALLYSALTGVAPNAGETLHEVATSTLRPVKPPSAHRPAVPAGLEAICMRALEREPARRFASASELAAELQAWLAGRGAARSRPAWFAASALVVSAAALALLIASQTQPPATQGGRRG